MSRVNTQILWCRYRFPLEGLRERMRPAARLTCEILVRPRLALLWLQSARRAQLALAVVVLLLVAAGPSVCAAIAGTVFPPVTVEKRVLLVIKTNRVVADAWHEPAYQTLLAGVWLLGLAFAGLLFVDHAPAAVRLARHRARRLLAMATNETDALKSARLFATAHDLMIDPPAGDERRSADPPIATGQSAAKTVLISAANPETTRYLGEADRYRLDSVIDSGGMGVVHAGYDTVLQRPVACKQLFAHLSNDPQQNLRFRQEATALAALSHPHIVGVFDLLEESGSFWIVMELLTGGSLGHQMRGGDALPIDDSVDVICKIADGLGYAHGKGTVHRDVKPMNILFTEAGVPKLADFGNAKPAVPSVYTQQGATMGSPMYISPEQAAGDAADFRSDIYSLGVTLYHVVTGRVPFKGELREILAQHIGREPVAPEEINPQVSGELSDTILTMLSKDPDSRFQDTNETINALRRSVGVAMAV